MNSMRTIGWSFPILLLALAACKQNNHNAYQYFRESGAAPAALIETRANLDIGKQSPIGSLLGAGNMDRWVYVSAIDGKRVMGRFSKTPNPLPINPGQRVIDIHYGIGRKGTNDQMMLNAESGQTYSFYTEIKEGSIFLYLLNSRREIAAKREYKGSGNFQMSPVMDIVF